MSRTFKDDQRLTDLVKQILDCKITVEPKLQLQAENILPELIDAEALRIASRVNARHFNLNIHKPTNTVATESAVYFKFDPYLYSCFNFAQRSDYISSNVPSWYAQGTFDGLVEFAKVILEAYEKPFVTVSNGKELTNEEKLELILSTFLSLSGTIKVYDVHCSAMVEKKVFELAMAVLLNITEASITEAGWSLAQ